MTVSKGQGHNFQPSSGSHVPTDVLEKNLHINSMHMIHTGFAILVTFSLNGAREDVYKALWFTPPPSRPTTTPPPKKDLLMWLLTTCAKWVPPPSPPPSAKFFSCDYCTRQVTYTTLKLITYFYVHVNDGPCSVKENNEDLLEMLSCHPAILPSKFASAL